MCIRVLLKRLRKSKALFRQTAFVLAGGRSALPAGGDAAGRGGATLLRSRDSRAGLCGSEPAAAPRAGFACRAGPARLHGVRMEPER